MSSGKVAANAENFLPHLQQPKTTVEKLPSALDREEEEAVVNQYSPPAPLSCASVNKLDSNINQILPRLYLGDDIIARNLDELRRRRITHILNLTTNIPNKFEPEIRYLKLTIFDFESQNISQYFDEATVFIHEALQDERNTVLVHCNAGISRSASFVCAYLMKKAGYKTFKEAFAYVRKCRPVVAPNRGFEKQLINLESQNRKKLKCVVM